MELQVEQGWRKGDVKQLCKNLHPRDREECRFLTDYLPGHIQEVVEDMQEHCTSVHDERGRLWWLGGVAPSRIPEYPDAGFAWLLKTKWAKPKRKAEKAAMRAALAKVIDLAVTKTEYTKIGNIIWDQQKTNLRWLESEGFTINYEGAGVLTLPNGKQGTFYQFAKEIRR